MEIKRSVQGSIIVVSPVGRLGFDEAAGAQEHFEGAVADASNGLVCDCSGLEYISSAGLRAFLIAAKAAEQKGISLVACNLNENVESIFTISGFDRIVPLHDTLESALAALSSD